MPRTASRKLGTLSAYHDQQTHGWRVGTILFVKLSVLAQVLAAIGVYAVLDFVVTQHK